MDECTYEPIDLAALTGVLVPLEQYATVRDAIGKVIWDAQNPPENTVPQPIELHGRDLLSQLPFTHQIEHDEACLNVLANIVGIINVHELNVIRYAYLNYSEISKIFKGDLKLYGLNFSNMLYGLQDVLETAVVLPVMDGIPSFTGGASKPPRIVPQLINAFARNIRYMHHSRNLGSVTANLSVHNFHNLAEPVFSDSRHSVCLQLVDVVSHMLLQLEKNELEPQNVRGDYQLGVIQRAERINPDLLHLWKGKLQMEQPTR